MLTVSLPAVAKYCWTPFFKADFFKVQVIVNCFEFFPEWDASQTKGEFTLANFKSTMGKTLADSLTKGLKSGDVYAIIKFNDLVTKTDSNHRSYDTGVVQKNGQRPLPAPLFAITALLT